MTETMINRDSLCEIAVDEAGLRLSTDAEHEKRVAIWDMLEENSFRLIGRDLGPYRLRISTASSRLALNIFDAEGAVIVSHLLSLKPFRRLIRDYQLICEAHVLAANHGNHDRIQAIDMGRRALHNEASEMLQQRLMDKIEMDKSTARRLFTLICVLVTPSRTHL